MSDKMSTEQFCLRWNDFHSNITSAFSDIRDDDEFLDVTLVCDGDIVRAHKLVLSACSPLFRIMLKKNSHPQPMIFLRGIRFPDMVAILNFMYRGEVNVNQEDLQNFLAAAEELRIKGLSQASNDSKLEKLDNSVPKMKQVSGGSSNGQPPAKKPRESSPGNSPSSTPVSAKSPGPEEEEPEPPQLSVKREFSLAAGGKRENSEGAVMSVTEEEEDSQQSNLLDCLVQAQNFAIQQAAGNKNFENNINNFPSGHLMPGSGGAQMSSSQNDKDLIVGGSSGAGAGAGGGSPAPGGQNMKFGGLPYEMHRLGGRNEDGLANVVVMKTFRGWHCPHCSYISPSQKGNLKVHILNRHANPGESFGCMFCGKHLSSRSSLQVHISQVHREEQKAKRMIEERLKITNLEDRLKTEMTGGVMGDINTTTEALRLALQQEERLKLDMGSLKNMESLLGSAGMARMLQMMEVDAKNFGAGLSTSGGLESGPGSSSGSVPHSPKQTGQSPENGGPPGPQQIRREVELTKVSGEASLGSLQYQRDIGAHHSSLANYRREESEEEVEEVEEMEDGDSDSVYPKDLSSEGMRGHLEPSALVYPSSPMYSQHGQQAQPGMTGSD